MTNLTFAGRYSSSHKRQRLSHAMFSVLCCSLDFNPSSIYVTNRLQWQVFSMSQGLRTYFPKRATWRGSLLL